VAEFLKTGYRKLDKELRTRTRSAPSGDKHIFYRSYANFFERILERIRDKFHGGTVVVVPDDIHVDDIRLQDRIIIKYPCSYDAMELLINALVEAGRYSGIKEKLRKEKEISKRQFSRLTSNEILRDNAEELLKPAPSFIASLAAVDGAVVLTDKLRLLGFGAEITAQSPMLSQIKVITDFEKNTGENKDIELFGTRHRSAFRFCSGFENSIVFIVSQDGEIKITKRVGSEVFLWLNINVGSMGF
jgi:hypothetical protein